MTRSHTPHRRTRDGNDTATVDVTVNPVNDPPVAVDDSNASTPQGVAKDVNVLANDSDMDVDTRSVTGNTQGANGSVSCTAAGVLHHAERRLLRPGFIHPHGLGRAWRSGYGDRERHGHAREPGLVSPARARSLRPATARVTFTLSSASVKLAQSSGRKFTFDGAVASVGGGAGRRR